MDLVVFFFFKKKTAYDMRISDWSSDVCSSDLAGARTGAGAARRTGLAARPGQTQAGRRTRRPQWPERHPVSPGQPRFLAPAHWHRPSPDAGPGPAGGRFRAASAAPRRTGRHRRGHGSEDSRVGKSGSVRLDLGGRRCIKKKNTYSISKNPTYK